jgi:hypothetical protein
MNFREFGASGSPRLGKTPIRKRKPRRRGEHRGFGFPFCGGKPVVGREAHHDNIVTSATLSDNCSVSSCRPSPATVGHLCSHQISREDVDGGKYGGKPGNGCRAFLFSQAATKFSSRLNQLRALRVLHSIREDFHREISLTRQDGPLRPAARGPFLFSPLADTALTRNGALFIFSANPLNFWWSRGGSNP